MKRVMYVAIGMALGIGVMALYPYLAVEPVAAVATPSGNGDVNGSGAIDIADAIYLLSYLFASGPGPEAIVCNGGAGALPATGQDMCYDGNGNIIDCASVDYPGQDGFYRAGCPKEGRYVDNGDGTVTDNCTGLMWQKATAPGAYAWQNALKYCEGLTLAGHSDWRLPNIRELLSIVDYGRSAPAIDPVFQAISSGYWSSSSFAGWALYAWDVNFVDGNDFDVAKVHSLYVRAVRSGP